MEQFQLYQFNKDKDGIDIAKSIKIKYLFMNGSRVYCFLMLIGLISLFTKFIKM